jgi:hypothetical protein
MTNFDIEFLNHNGVAEAILAAGASLTPIVLGETGIGKTSVQKTLARILKSHDPIYVDMPNTDVGYLSMMVPDRDTKKIEEYTGSLLRLDDPHPKLIMLDEIGKMPRILLPTVTRMMYERTVGNTPLPKGSIVWATSNLTTDGLGDFLPGHVLNRGMVIHQAKPNAVELNVHYTEIGVSSMTRAWLAMNPRAMHSYLTCSKDELATNTLGIFNPAKKQTSFLTPRSLHAADTNIVKKWDRLKPSVAHAMLQGTVGQGAAHSMTTFFSMAKDIIPIEDILNNPMTTQIPEKDAAMNQMMFNAIDTVETQDDLSKFIQYLDRKDSNIFTALFYTMAMSTKRTMKLARENSNIKAWVKIPGNYQMMI